MPRRSIPCATKRAPLGAMSSSLKLGTAGAVVRDAVPLSLSDATLAPGATWAVKFTQPGTYNYLCTIHAPNMKGVIHVTGSAAPAGASGASPSASATPSPAT